MFWNPGNIAQSLTAVSPMTHNTEGKEPGEGHASWNFNAELTGRAGRVEQTCSVYGKQAWPHPSDSAGDWHLGVRAAEQSSQLLSNRPLQVWVMFFLRWKGVLPMVYKSLKISFG
jgi:hypothetical protein